MANIHIYYKTFKIITLNKAKFNIFLFRIKNKFYHEKHNILHIGIDTTTISCGLLVIVK